MNRKFILALAVFFGGVALAGTDPSDTFRLGNGSSSTDKKIIINQGTAPYPALKWNHTSGTLQFTNDGTNFSDLGSGSGSGQGFNVLVNPDYESGVVLGFTNSGGTLTAATSGSNLLLGKGSAVFTASGSGQIFASAFYTIPNGLTGRSCSVSVLYKGGSANLTLQAYDGTNVLASAGLPPVTTATTVSAPFLCPSSGNFQWRVISSGSAAATAFDTAFLGQNVISQVSQANYVGGVSVPNGCQYDTTSTTIGDLAQISGCSGFTLLGSASSFADSTNGAVTFNNLPPGEYVAKFIGVCGRGNASSNQMYFNMTDGTTYSVLMQVFSGAAGVLGIPCILESHFSYSTPGNRTFKIQGYANSADNAEFTTSANGAIGSNEFFSLYRYPSQSDLAVRPDTINWRVGGYFYGTNNFELGTGNTASFSETIAVGGTTFANEPGTLSSLPTCDGTNGPSDSTCSGGGTPDLGIVFNQPSAGDDEVCVDFSHLANISGASALVDEFVLVETPVNAQTILQKGVHQSSDRTQGNTLSQYQPLHHCEIFHFSSSGQKAIRLFFEQSTSGTVNGSQIWVSSASLGSSSPKFTIRPITQNVPAPILVGGVISQSSGVLDIEFASVGGVTATSDCVSNPCTLKSNSPGISSVSYLGTGSYQVNFALGTFSAEPVCVGNSIHSGTAATFLIPADGFECTTTECRLQNYNTSASLTDGRFYVQCTGPH